MKPLDLFRRAVAEIGDASAAELSAHLEKQHGMKVEPAFIPVFKATLRDFGTNGKAASGGKTGTTDTGGLRLVEVGTDHRLGREGAAGGLCGSGLTGTASKSLRQGLAPARIGPSSTDSTPAVLPQP